MLHISSHSTLYRRGYAVTQRALSLFFVLAAAFFMNNASIFSQTSVLTPQKTVSTNADDFNQNADNASKNDSPKNNDALEFVRITRRDGALSRLETSVVGYKGRYQATDGAVRDVTVDLISAIHIAEIGYYEEINALFKDYETVVFELVSDSNVDVAAALRQAREERKNKRNLNPLNFISYFQEDVGKYLKLAYQIDGIDYSAPNLRHGDCSMVELIVWTLSNGDVLNFLLEIFASSFLDGSPGVGEGAVVATVCANDKRLALKRLFALQLGDSSLADANNGYRALEKGAGASKSHESALIHLRNKKALSVLRQELDGGRDHVAIFFGAAHLPDLGARLEAEFGLTRQDEPRWLKAWDLESVAP